MPSSKFSILILARRNRHSCQVSFLCISWGPIACDNASLYRPKIRNDIARSTRRLAMTAQRRKWRMCFPISNGIVVSIFPSEWPWKLFFVLLCGPITGVTNLVSACQKWVQQQLWLLPSYNEVMLKLAFFSCMHTAHAPLCILHPSNQELWTHSSQAEAFEEGGEHGLRKVRRAS